MNEEKAMEILKDDYEKMLRNVIDNKVPINMFVHYVIYSSVGLSMKFIPDETNEIVEAAMNLASFAWQRIDSEDV